MFQIRELRSRLPLKAIIPILLISVLCIGSFASTITATTTTYEGMAAATYKVTDNFAATSLGFTVAPTSKSASSQPFNWVNEGVVTEATTETKWQYSVTVTMHTGATASHGYSVNVQWSADDATYTDLGTLTFTSPASITDGETMTFMFNVGDNIYTSTGIVVTVS